MSSGDDDNRKQTKTRRQAPIRTLIEESASEGNYCDFLFLSDGSFISAAAFSHSSGDEICKHFTLNGRLTRTFSSGRTGALSDKRNLLWVEQDVTFLCCTSYTTWIDIFSVNSSKPILNVQFDFVHTVKLIDESFQMRHLFLSSTHTGALRVWELTIEEYSSKRMKKLSAVYSDIIGLKSEPIFWWRGDERTSLCALKGGRFVEMNATTDTIALWEKTSSSTLQWQRTRLFRTGDKLEQSLHSYLVSFEVYDGMAAVCGLGYSKFNVVVFDPSGDSFFQRYFEVGDCKCVASVISLSMKDSANQVQTQKRLICCLSQNGCLWFWDLDDGTLVKKVHSEQLSSALCMTSGLSASGDALLLVGRISEERQLFTKRSRLQITVVDVLQLIHGDAVIASTSSPVPSKSPIHDYKMAKSLSFGHLKSVTALEVMEDGMVLSGALDGIIKLWSPDMQRVIRSFYLWLSSTPTNCDLSHLKSAGEGWFVSISVNPHTIRAKHWSVRQSEDDGHDVAIKLNRYQSTKEVLVVASNIICTIDGTWCQVWSLTDGSLKHEFRGIQKIGWLVDLGTNHTEDGKRQHLITGGSNVSTLIERFY